jgi:hypothetical protein
VAEATFEEVSVIGFKDSQAGAERLALGNNDDVVASSEVVTAENLSYQSFSSISLHRAAELFCGRDAQAADIPVVGQDEDRRVPAVRPRAVVVDALELSAATNPVLGAESQSLFVADRQALAPFGAAALQHEPAVFRAHAHQKSMRARAPTPVRLERPFPLHETPSESDESPIISDVFEGCQCTSELC